MSSEERCTLRDLKSNFHVVIRQADKVSAVVVLERQRYMQEGYRLLNDTTVYQRTEGTVVSDNER
ncbi:hypothetical protein HOLleu_39709 [Holothuria leucospilota]|uniref:Uncharacterized protein n=1 Tax=Holothuria leucospilota TaxID=206669 RepID=A0A9Q0YET5_HOLLE|nr:hypothetical protein HOLleu_39709 [Holothuria leucospilota]